MHRIGDGGRAQASRDGAPWTFEGACGRPTRAARAMQTFSSSSIPCRDTGCAEASPQALCVLRSVLPSRREYTSSRRNSHRLSERLLPSCHAIRTWLAVTTLDSRHLPCVLPKPHASRVSRFPTPSRQAPLLRSRGQTSPVSELPVLLSGASTPEHTYVRRSAATVHERRGWTNCARLYTRVAPLEGSTFGRHLWRASLERESCRDAAKLVQRRRRARVGPPSVGHEGGTFLGRTFWASVEGAPVEGHQLRVEGGAC